MNNYVGTSNIDNCDNCGEKVGFENLTKNWQIEKYLCKKCK